MESESVLDASDGKLDDTGQYGCLDTLHTRYIGEDESVSAELDNVGVNPRGCGDGLSAMSALKECGLNEHGEGTDETKSYLLEVNAIEEVCMECGEKSQELSCVEQRSKVRPRQSVDFTLCGTETVNRKEFDRLELSSPVYDSDSQTYNPSFSETMSFNTMPSIQESYAGEMEGSVRPVDSLFTDTSLLERRSSVVSGVGDTQSSGCVTFHPPKNVQRTLSSHELKQELPPEKRYLKTSFIELSSETQTVPSKLMAVAIDVVEECISRALLEVHKIKLAHLSPLNHEDPLLSSDLKEASASTKSEPLHLFSSSNHPAAPESARSSECALIFKDCSLDHSAHSSDISSFTSERNLALIHKDLDVGWLQDLSTLNNGLKRSPETFEACVDNISCQLSEAHECHVSMMHECDTLLSYKGEISPVHPKVEIELDSSSSSSTVENIQKAVLNLYDTASYLEEIPSILVKSNSKEHTIEMPTRTFSSESLSKSTSEGFCNSSNIKVANCKVICSNPKGVSGGYLHDSLELSEQQLLPSLQRPMLKEPIIQPSVSLCFEKKLNAESSLISNLSNKNLQNVSDHWALTFVEEILATATSIVESQRISPVLEVKSGDEEVRKIASVLVNDILSSAALHVTKIMKQKQLENCGEVIMDTQEPSQCSSLCESDMSRVNRLCPCSSNLCCQKYPVDTDSIEDITLPKGHESELSILCVSNQVIPSCDLQEESTSRSFSPHALHRADLKDVSVLNENGIIDMEVDCDSFSSESKSTSSELLSSVSTKCSSHTISDPLVQKEVSLFVDGVIEIAIKQYENETSSNEASPLERKRPEFDFEFSPQEAEELATPCGEMVTEHFMDFESGRNVSVFCCSDDSMASSCEKFSALDRVANTIGNREVDSDTGKSLSVFRSEEDIFYEIQRASTCTSVFESVEEEDEDVVDTSLIETVSTNCAKSLEASAVKEERSDTMDTPAEKDADAFEDAVDAFLEKERLIRNELKTLNSPVEDLDLEAVQSQFSLSEENQLRKRQGTSSNFLKNDSQPASALAEWSSSKLSSEEEKKIMAERWANGVPDTPEMHEKVKAIRDALDSEVDVASKLCKLALTEGGLINDALRREAWPRMLGLDPSLEMTVPSLEDLKSHPEYEQVVLDVNRSLKRFPPDIPREHRETLQDQLTHLIMFVISKHPHLRYYQGYHDVAVTFLLVVGEAAALQIMERLSTEHLSDCMQPTMERTSYLLHFIYPLIHRLHPTLAEYLERSEVGTMFCLPWFLTWFGHSLNRYQDVVRLYDHFLASPPLAPLYLAAVLVAHRADEVLAVDCDMAAIHALLSNIPDTLPLEILLCDATDLYQKYPPESIEKEVEERFQNEQDSRLHEMEARERLRQHRASQRRHAGSGSWQLAELQQHVGPAVMLLNRWVPPWVAQQQRLSMRLLFASATFFVGFYVYARGDVFS